MNDEQCLSAPVRAVLRPQCTAGPGAGVARERIERAASIGAMTVLFDTYDRAARSEGTVGSARVVARFAARAHYLLRLGPRISAGGDRDPVHGKC
jgi:hypothetical protein